jgi:hypothetical protein
MIARFLRHLFCPAPRMAGCTPKTEADRLADWEIRLGQHKAQERLRQARAAQLLDERAIVRTKVAPKLPADRKVVSIRRKRAA